jgi:ArsR family transcriptional regulator
MFRGETLDKHQYFDIYRNMEHRDAVTALGALAHGQRPAAVRLLLEHAPVGLPGGAIRERLGLASTTLSFHLEELARARASARRASR